MKKYFTLFCLLLCVIYSKASRYDSTMVSIDRYTLGDDCSGASEAKGTFVIVRDPDSMIKVFHFIDAWLNQWDNFTWTKYHLDSNRIPYLKEDSVSRTFLSNTAYMYDSLQRAIQELSQVWDTITNTWINIYRISRVYDSNGNLTSELKELFESASQTWFTKYMLQQSFNATNQTLVITYITYPDFALNQNGGYLDSFIYDINNFQIEKITQIWNTSTTSYINSARVFAVYNGFLLAEGGNQSWDSTYWRNQNKTEYYYDGNGNDTLDLTYAGDSVFWNSSSRIYMVYNGLGQLTEKTNQVWDSVSWDYTTRTQFDYAANGKVQRDIEQYWDSNAWNNSSQIYYEYDFADSISLQMNLMGVISTWDSLSRKIYDYASHFPINETIFSEEWYSPGNWGCEPVGGTLHNVFDTLNRLVYLHQTWCGGGMSGFTGYYAYDTSGFLYNQVTQSCTMGGLGTYHDISNYHLLLTVPSISNDSLCIGDTTTISFSLSGGVPSYHIGWSSQNNIPDTTALSNTIIVRNNSPIVFYDIDSLGNVSIDTIHIFVSPVVNLGNDITICGSGSVTLNSENGDSTYSYQWQNGSSDSLFTASSTGQYWVSVTDTSGCINSDTISVSFFSLPFLNLGNDTSICDNSNLTLEVGAGFQSYLWQDNSTDSFLIISSNGDYWVEVTDTNGCSNSDTISVSIFPIPSIELGNDTMVCNDISIVIHAGSGFASYLWQDNSNDSILIASTQSAGYDTLFCAVEVTDSNFCSASDSITVYFQICLGLPETSSNNFLLFPNPVLRNSVIYISGQGRDFAFKLSDVDGREVKYALIEEDSEKITLENIDPGIYFFEIMFLSRERFTGKLLIQ